MKVSDCCGAAPIGNGDMSLEDVGICSACREHCEYVEEGQEQVETPLGEQVDSQGELQND